MKKRYVSVLAFVLCFSMLPISVSAVDDTTNKVTVVEKVEEDTFEVDGFQYRKLSNDVAELIGCTDKTLTTISIPATVEGMEVQFPDYFGNRVFADCENIETISVDADNESICSVDGVLYTKDMKTLLCYPHAKSGSYTIPDGVTKIGAYAFSDCTGITQVVLSDSLTLVESKAFQNCVNLTEIVGSIPLKYGDSVSGCSNLRSLKLAENLKLTSLFFSGLDALEELIIPESTTFSTSGGISFTNCNSLTELDLSALSLSQTGVGISVSSCASLKKLTLPNMKTTDEEGTGSGLFVKDCPLLETIIIPKTVDAIGGAITLQNCPALQALLVENDAFTPVDMEDALTVSECDALTVYTNSDAMAEICAEADVPYAALEQNVMIGDVNQDGKVDLVDGIFLSKANANIIQLSETQETAADCDGNGTRDDKDLSILMQFNVMLIDQLPYLEQ
jgi:hypothetical protein